MADTTNPHELLVTTFATADALAKLLIEKGVITQDGKSFRRTDDISKTS